MRSNVTRLPVEYREPPEPFDERAIWDDAKPKWHRPVALVLWLYIFGATALLGLGIGWMLAHGVYQTVRCAVNVEACAEGVR